MSSWATFAPRCLPSLELTRSGGRTGGERRDWYQSHFDPAKPVRGESTPAYSAWAHREHVPERAAELLPAAKLVYVVRDPIARIASHFVQERANGSRKPFRYYLRRLEEPDNPVICPSRYATQLERWLAVFDRSQLMVIDHQRLLVEREAVLRSLFEWIGLDPDVTLDLTGELNRRDDKITRRRWAAAVRWIGLRAPQRLKRHVARPGAQPSAAQRLLWRTVAERAEIDAAARERLAEHLRPEVERLRVLTGMGFESWSL
jgi:hypothetical protein